MNKNFPKILSNIPNEKFKLESDATFITLDKNNFFSTAEIEKIVTKLAVIKGINIEDIKYILFNNFKEILN